ncbi:recombinase RecJ [Halosimplex rubrum]|uniref:Recombinase RecJ n=1 Tax=Halosimplex rubrum TaxID=869889 RepID=A0A7D5PAX2_9EURY|nr:recombinase RecJ [Halosimplex rubrum]QLH78520.1 recombinase RecJ [Halosimplex rubrum]
MDDWIIDGDRLPLERKSVLPGEGFFYPDSLRETKKESEAVEALSGAETVVIADTDADGLGCVALIREVHGDDAALVPSGPHELRQSIEWAVEYAPDDAVVFVCDLCPDGEGDIEGIEALAERTTVRWFDHHQWDDGIAAAVEAAGVELTVGDSDEVCTTDVALAQLDYGFPEQFEALARVTRDHDLWIKEDERSDDLADYAMWADPEEYVRVIRRYGVDFPEAVEEFLAEERIEKEALIEKAVERGELREVGEWTVGVTYGRCSQNEVAEAMRREGADASVIVKPAGSASIRGSEGFERAHEVAEQVNGGGHPRAAGCKPHIYDDMLDYAHHWTTRGAVAKQAILDAFRALPPEEEAEGVDTER